MDFNLCTVEINAESYDMGRHFANFFVRTEKGRAEDASEFYIIHTASEASFLSSIILLHTYI